MRSRAGRGSRTSRRLEQHLTTRAAAALDRADAVGRVVVGDLLALSDVSRRSNPDGVADHLRVAVGCARVVDVARDVAPDCRIADPQTIQLEAPDVALLEVPLLALQ